MAATICNRSLIIATMAQPIEACLLQASTDNDTARWADSSLAVALWDASK